MIEIEVAGETYELPSSAMDTNWAAKQVLVLQALAEAVDTALGTPTWAVRTLSGGWLAIGGDYGAPASYLDPFSMVHLRVATQAGADGTSCMTLPAGQRPPYPVTFDAVCDTGGTVRVEIGVDGTVTLTGNGVDAGDGTIFETAFSVVANPP